MSRLRVAPSHGDVAFARDNHVVIHYRTYNAGAQVFRTMFVGKHQVCVGRGTAVKPGYVLGMYPEEPLLD